MWSARVTGTCPNGGTVAIATSIADVEAGSAGKATCNRVVWPIRSRRWAGDSGVHTQRGRPAALTKGRYSWSPRESSR